ncbi:hypothetical protein B0H11DRAFT_2287921 [Mycena galericulata]|nr:hypothetical protein B0H11DRAFT_2287921 [Mycena galericulata]
MLTHPTDSHSPPAYEDVATSYGKNGYSRVSPEEPNDLGRRASEPRYVYYRVYAMDGPLRCKKPHEDNPYLGRVKATSVPPPHTSASLKRVLVQVEALPDPTGELTGLFQTNDACTVLASNGNVEILTGDIGETAQTAVALVFLAAPEEPLNTPSTDEAVSADDDDVPYLYYRLYTRGGEDKSVRSFDAAEQSLGRVKRSSIAPPRNVLSVKRRIAKVEAKTIYSFADLFTDLKAKKAHSTDAVVANTVGASKDDPIFLVQPERRPGLLNRPVMIVASLSESALRLAFWPSIDWSHSKGDILFTDGVRHRPLPPIPFYQYDAVDDKGKRKRISAHPNDSKLLDEEPSSSSECSIQ